MTPAASHLMKNTLERKQNVLINNDSIRQPGNNPAETIDLYKSILESKPGRSQKSPALHKFFESLKKRPSIPSRFK